MGTAQTLCRRSRYIPAAAIETDFVWKPLVVDVTPVVFVVYW